MNIKVPGTPLLNGAIALIGLGFGIYQSHKASQTAKKLDMTINDVEKKSNVEISRAIVDKAIEQAVDREVRIAVSDTARRVREDMHSEIHREVKKAVDGELKRISEEVSERVSDEVATIDIDVVREKVTRKAEDKVVKKLDTVLDGATNLFNKNLGGQLKVYQGIADTIGNVLSSASGKHTGGSGVTFRME